MAKYYVDKVTGTFGVVDDLVVVNCKDYNETNKFLTVAANQSESEFIKWATEIGTPLETK